MALGDPYATLTSLKSRLGITDADDDTELNASLDAASRGVDRLCRRQFNKTTSATARKYYPARATKVTVDDFHTTTDLVVKIDEDDDGTFETTIPAADYQLEPLDGVVDGVDGWPFERIRIVDGILLPKGRRATVEVTAQWGWAAVPDPVVEATLIAAAELFKLKDAPFGVAGFDGFGAVRIRDNPVVMRLLAPYRLTPVLVG